MATILILGARSDIGSEIARQYAEKGNNLILAARNSSLNDRLINDLKIRYGIDAESAVFDALAFDTHDSFYRGLSKKPDGVVCVFGYLGDNDAALSDFEESRKIIDSNYTACVSILNIAARDFEDRGGGFIIGISSVAGDRGRANNIVYGSAKAGFTAYLSALRNRLSGSGVQVLTVKPGFVDTKMTEHLNLPDRLTSQPSEVAADIVNSQQKGRNVIYSSWIWRYIMLIIRHIPEFIFKRMKI